jgi:phosphoribosyl 1,2-cyclic phosphate phosphodiesterase
MHHKMPVTGFRFGDFTYITDANYIAPEEKEKIKGSKILVLNALRHEKHISHFTLNEAIEIGCELEIPQLYLTHISHQLGLHDEVTKSLPDGVALAYDGLHIEI